MPKALNPTWIGRLPSLPSLLAGILLLLPQSGAAVREGGVGGGRDWPRPAVALTLLVTELHQVPQV